LIIDKNKTIVKNKKRWFTTQVTVTGADATWLDPTFLNRHPYWKTVEILALTPRQYSNILANSSV
jgi:hypothetical protein